MLTDEPSSILASLAKDFGIRNPRLLPHFWIFVTIVDLHVYT
jgi:hypothetical protein